MVTTFFGSQSFGGDAAYVERLSRALLSRGHEVAVVHCADAFEAVRGDHPLRRYRPPAGLEVHTLYSAGGRLSPLWTHQTGGAGPKAARLRAIFRDGDFDVVHFHNISLVGGPGAIELAPPSAVRVMTAHEHWMVCPTSLLWKMGREPCTQPQCERCTMAARRPPQLWRHSGRISRAIRMLDAYACPSRHTAELHRERGIDIPIDVLPYFVPRAWAQGGASFDAPRPYVAAAGRLVTEKGFGGLIDAMRRLPEIDLVLAGTGPLEEELRERSRDLPNVRMTGLLDPPRLASLFAGARALVVPSLFWETFGYVVAEAARVGTPAIVHDRGAPPELVRNSGGGLVYRTPGELVEAIRTIAGDSGLREELGARALAAADGIWSEERHVGAYLGLIGRRGRGRLLGVDVDGEAGPSVSALP
jgi:glycosyltransferase involved in cell wall biosynthesis